MTLVSTSRLRGGYSCQDCGSLGIIGRPSVRITARLAGGSVDMRSQPPRKSSVASARAHSRKPCTGTQFVPGKMDHEFRRIAKRGRNSGRLWNRKQGWSERLSANGKAVPEPYHSARESSQASTSRNLNLGHRRYLEGLSPSSCSAGKPGGRFLRRRSI